MSDTKQELEELCRGIAEELSQGPTMEWAEDNDIEVEDGLMPSGYDWVEANVMGMAFIINEGGEYMGARLVVASGGPSAYIDLETNTVRGDWWGTKAEAEFRDNWDLEQVARDRLEFARDR